MSIRARRVIEEADAVVGYKTYIELIRPFLAGKEVLSSGMTKEVDRSRIAIDRALAGARVAVVSSGDPGVYGMAGIVLELLEKDDLTDRIDVEVVPGITSATAAAASLGAPLTHDFAVISLSDLLTPWEVIKKRLELAAEGDFVTILYNPVSKKRTEQIKTAREIFLKHKSGRTPVGIVRNAKREGEEVVISDLDNFLTHPIDMFTVVIIGNKQTYRSDFFMLTPRGYKI